jgi:hypothetical protein
LLNHLLAVLFLIELLLDKLLHAEVNCLGGNVGQEEVMLVNQLNGIELGLAGHQFHLIQDVLQVLALIEVACLIAPQCLDVLG